jgi:hypothetical protein
MPVKISERDTGERAFYKAFASLGKLRAKVGVQPPEASDSHEDGITFVELMTIHEFGAPAAGIPQRSPLRSTADINQRKYLDGLAKVVKTAKESPDKAFAALNELGEAVRGDVVGRIFGGEIEPPLAPATVARKGEATPLFDTGALANSVTSTVGPPSRK